MANLLRPIVAIIQARMGSSRLPGKVLRNLCGRSVLAHVIARVSACPLIDRVVVATTSDPRDAAVVDEAIACDVETFRGSENDVLSRYHAAAEMAQAATIVRITSDCPLLDPVVLGRMIEMYVGPSVASTPYDYLTNTGWPRGLDIEICTRAALDRAAAEAHKPYEREHVTPFLYQHPEWFHCGEFFSPVDRQHERWTLDTEDDWALIERICTAFPSDAMPDCDAIVALLERNPEWRMLNAHVVQKSLC